MMNLEADNIVIPSLGVTKTSEFSKVYPILNRYILDNLDIQASRAGSTRELLDFKTMLTNPYNRCVGGFDRNINIFFLLAEAMWIFNGRKDVEFLKLFNEKMSDFSDDGKVFHAPYGFRLRHWGVRSEDKFVEENMSASQGYDQLADALKLFHENIDTRQVVLQIWNPDFDLGAKTKDTPCNDTVMLKIRDGKLITTIQNRSNDLHWGLPTNIFQFSFLTELFANCLDIELGTQTHNSQSLHIYEWNPTADKMRKLFNEREALGELGKNAQPELYEVSNSRKIDFNFEHSVPGNRLREIDLNLNIIISNLMKISKGEPASLVEVKSIQKFSNYLYMAYNLCAMYLQYKHLINEGIDKDEMRLRTIKQIEAFCEIHDKSLENSDIIVLAKNFFAARISGYSHNFLGKL